MTLTSNTSDFKRHIQSELVVIQLCVYVCVFPCVRKTLAKLARTVLCVVKTW